MTTPARGLVLASLAALAVGATRAGQRDDGRADEQAAARRELAATTLAPSGGPPQAGISTRITTNVPAIPDRLARGGRITRSRPRSVAPQK